ncbi:superfamily II DNA or RNA helicase [Pedobacter sp. AK013]|uniref:DEAD/DEAH box helicase n=1 Tax=Pedobacter sp. AK013 TaxID=2723071 RepID=UPI00161C8B3C|nr:DEAD/DEAH box helicase family protein [Pedobacter sp. AK013]MBB6239948.1 superfamily II DNA or RNA helicase [Pedobacter sp. AK013]
MNCFEKGYGQINLFAQKDGKQGLYKNQIGAIGSAMAHFSVRSEPALITMPTGTGKTAVMIVLAYALQGKKVLVITPSQLVREQIVENFRNPKVLVDKKIIPGGSKLPKVFELTKIIDDSIEWKRILKENDVVVAIPGTLNKISDLRATIGYDTFDVVFVDEAHHSRASSWLNILEAFSFGKQILLTATPFRRDKKDIQARLIYNYPLKNAFEDGLFSKINFVPATAPLSATAEEKNIAIALKAQEVYSARLHQEHRIIIRTDRKKDADDLEQIYINHTQLKLVVIHSKLGSSTIRSRISQLTSGEIDGVICVDMMGEGYDFPALKIAAVHIPHKSLAITLQFVGRISRTNTAEGSIATVIAGEHEFKIDSHQLYKEDTKDWSVILPDLHKMKIQKTEDEQGFFDSFTDVSDEAATVNISYEEPLALEDDDFKPFFHAKIYRIIPAPVPERDNEGNELPPVDIRRNIDFSGTDVFKNPIIRHHHVSSIHDVAVHVVAEPRTPSWYGKDDSLKDVNHEFFVTYFDQDNSLLFIGATSKETELYEHIALQYLRAGALHDMVPLPFLKRVMAGWQEPRFYNLGLRSRKNKGNSESYKQLLGSQAELSVLPSDKFSYTRGHSFGGAFDTVLKKTVMLGVSTSSKVWTLGDNKIKYFVEWCAGIARKVGDPEMDNLDSPLSDLDTGKIIDEFPDVAIFFADWDHAQYGRNTSVVFLDQDDQPVEEALLCSCDIAIMSKTPSKVTLEISKNNIAARLEFTLLPKATFNYGEDTEHLVVVSRGVALGTPEGFLSIINENPINFFFEDLSKLVGRVYFPFKSENFKIINDEQIIANNWPADIDVRKEYYSDSEKTANNNSSSPMRSIHDYIIDLAKDEYDVVFYDHGSLEIADVIGMKKDKVQFWHCKKQSGEQPNCSIEDMYEVCGQAIKSVNWANRKLLLKQMIERADRNQSNSKLRKGTLTDAKTILENFNNPVIPVAITIVQPGLKTSGLTAPQQAAFDRIKVLLSGAETFLKDVSNCELLVMSS